MADTTTTLNPGVGGDVMDESLVTQSNGVTQAKRPRVVIAGDADGTAIVNPIRTRPSDTVHSVPALASGVVDEARPGGYLTDEVRPLSMTSDGRLRVASSRSSSYMDLFGDTAPLSTDPHDFLDVNNNPWGF